MRFLLPVLFFLALTSQAQKRQLDAIGPVNVGREYGSPSYPFVVSHLPKKNQAMLYRGRVPHHNMFTRLLCFKKYCRAKVGRQKALKSISFDKYVKKISKNAKKKAGKDIHVDTVKKVRKPIPPKQMVVPDTVVAVEAPILKSDSLIILGEGELLFATNSSTLRSEQFSTLDSIADFLIRNPQLIVKITGHTDNTGNESHNLKLSTSRADVVAEYLVDNGVAIDRVSSQGLGSSRPIAPNTTDPGRRKNRRVELLIHDKR